MQTVAIITGGKSPEHDIAIISSRNIYNALDSTLFNIQVIGISREGEFFHLTEKSLFDENIEIGQSTLHQPLAILPFNTQPIRYKNNIETYIEVDVFFPITHGTYGEDGVLQGLLEYTNRAYVGPGVLGSAIGMDKDVAKSLLAQAGINVTPWLTFFKNDIIDITKIEATLPYPLFLKPANMGSGVGVVKIENRTELEEALKTAFDFDIKIIIEKGIKGREIETAVIGNLNLSGTGVGEIIVDSGFYTYENKYINGATKVIIPAENMIDSTIQVIHQTALKAYRCLQLEGMSRVDFFYVNDTEFYLNEVNTLPGFTNISMYPKLWEAAGVGYTQLLTNLITTAEERFKMRSELRRER